MLFLTMEFKQFNVVFDIRDEDYYTMPREQLLDRVWARSLIRGCLMFNDLDFADDPWDYNVAKNRKGPDSSEP